MCGDPGQLRERNAGLAPTKSVVTSTEHDEAVATCKAVGLDYIGDDYADVVSEDITLEQV